MIAFLTNFEINPKNLQTKVLALKQLQNLQTQHQNANWKHANKTQI